MPGVLGMLTADDVPAQPQPGEPILTNEPMFVGQPDPRGGGRERETRRKTRSTRSRSTSKSCRSRVDPLESLFPGGPDARARRQHRRQSLDRPAAIQEVKWTAGDFARAQEGDKLPMGEPVVEWSFGDVDAGFKKAEARARRDVRDGRHVAPLDGAALGDGVLGERQVLRATARRRARASWCRVSPGCIGIEPDEPRATSPRPAAAASARRAPRIRSWRCRRYMSKKIGRPVMMRISRAEEYFLGSARTGFQGRIKIGFDKPGRVTAADLYIVQENGATTGFPRLAVVGRDACRSSISRTRCASAACAVMTNTPPRTAQRGPGHNQTVSAHRAADRQGREAARDRPARDPPLNGPRDEREVRREPGARHELLPAGGAREGRARLFNWEEREEAQRPEERHEGHRHRRRPGVPSGRVSPASTASCASRRTASCTSTPASAISARTRTRAHRASPPRC